MTEMSAWARELEAEVKVAAPNAPEPVYGLSEDGEHEGLSWMRDREIVAHGARSTAAGYESWWTLDGGGWAGEYTRAHFVRLVAEIWP